MRGFAILIFIVAFFWLVWPMIRKWLKRKAMERTEDYLRQAMGMPPREKDRKKRREDSSFKEDPYQRYYGGQRNRYERRRVGPIIPRDYPVDVEFVEYIDHTGTEYYQRISRHIKIRYESQISDAEWSEIKKPRTK